MEVQLNSNRMDHWNKAKLELLESSGFFASDLCQRLEGTTARWLQCILFEVGEHTQTTVGSAPYHATDAQLNTKQASLKEDLKNALIESGISDQVLKNLSNKEVKRLENVLQKFEPAELNTVTKLLFHLNYPMRYFAPLLRHLRRYVKRSNRKGYYKARKQMNLEKEKIGDLASQMSRDYIAVLKQDIEKVEEVNQPNYWNVNLLLSMYTEETRQKLASSVRQIIVETIPLLGSKRFPWLKAHMFPALMVFIWDATFRLKEHLMQNSNSNVDSLLERPNNRWRLLKEVDVDSRMIEKISSTYFFVNADSLVDVTTSYLEDLLDATDAVARTIHFIDVDLYAKLMMRIWNKVDTLDSAHLVLHSYNDQNSESFRALSAELLSSEWGPSVFYNGKIAMVPLLLSEVKEVFESISEAVGHMNHRRNINGEPGKIDEYVANVRHILKFGERTKNDEIVRDRRKRTIKRNDEIGVYSMTPTRQYITSHYRRKWKNNNNPPTNVHT